MEKEGFLKRVYQAYRKVLLKRYGVGIMLSVLLIFAFLFSSQMTSARAITCADNPTALWDFEEGNGIYINDSCNQNYIGTIYGIPDWVQGVWGNATYFHFNSTTNYADFGYILQGTYTDYSISLWVKRNGINEINSDQRIFELGTYWAGTHLEMTMMGFEYQDYIDTGFTGNVMLLYTPNITNEEWDNLITTFNGTDNNLSAYMNGEIIGSIITSTNSITVAETLLMSASHWDWNTINASIDNVAFFNRTLTEGEISVFSSVYATPITTCSVISTAGNYELANDIIDSADATCIQITSSDVSFDCQGYTIDGIDTFISNGIYADGLTNITIKNCTLSDWYYGINFANLISSDISYINAFSNYDGITTYNVGYSNISNINTSNNDWIGTNLYSFSLTDVSNIISNLNGLAGVNIMESYSSNFTNIETDDNLGNGFNLDTSLYNFVNNASSDGNAYYGFYLTTAISNNLTNLFVHNCLDISLGSGIYMYLSSYNRISASISCSNANDGIVLQQSSYNNISNSIFRHNNRNLLMFETSEWNEFYGNTFINETLPITITDSSNNLFYDNNFNNSVISTNSINFWNTTYHTGINILGRHRIGGNYWAGYNGTDNNTDGIGDTPYIIDSSNTDYLPLTLALPSLINVNSYLYVLQYPYVDCNTSYPITVIFDINGTRQQFGNLFIDFPSTNQTFSFTWNNVLRQYETTFIFPTGDYPFIVWEEFGAVKNITGTFIVRCPCYITINGYILQPTNQSNPYKNIHAYVGLEPISQRQTGMTGARNPYDQQLEDFLTPLTFSHYPYKMFHAQYINGQAVVKLWEKNVTYGIRLFDGDVTFQQGVYSTVNATKLYRTNIFLGSQKFECIAGSNEAFNYFFTQKELHPFTWLFNFLLLILIIVIIVVGAFLLFMYPPFALPFVVGGTIILCILRIVLWITVG